MGSTWIACGGSSDGALVMIQPLGWCTRQKTCPLQLASFKLVVWVRGAASEPRTNAPWVNCAVASVIQSPNPAANIGTVG